MYIVHYWSSGFKQNKNVQVRLKEPDTISRAGFSNMYMYMHIPKIIVLRNYDKSEFRFYKL